MLLRAKFLVRFLSVAMEALWGATFSDLSGLCFPSTGKEKDGQGGAEREEEKQNPQTCEEAEGEDGQDEKGQIACACPGQACGQCCPCCATDRPLGGTVPSGSLAELV